MIYYCLLQLSCFILIGICRGSPIENRFPLGDLRNCLNTNFNNTDYQNPQFTLQVLPGIGFDNLRNVEMSQVIQFNYSQCKTTSDGRFLLPDDFVVVPILRSRLDSYANLIEHWDDYTSMTSASINLGATVYSAISGKFGFEYQHVKQHQVRNSAKSTRIQMRTTLYKIILEPDAQLHPKFKNRLLDIAANIQSNNTAYAAYLSELLIRDYGSHILRSVEAGAIVSQIDSISSEYVLDKKGSLFNITASAAASFKGKFGFAVSGGVSHGHGSVNEYHNNRYHSQVITIGGPPVHPNMTIDEWTSGIWGSLVAVDRSGDPLHYVITPTVLPELPSPTLRELVEYVHRGVRMYYSVNTHEGCTDPGSPHFNFEANIDDGSCGAPRTNYSFGGVFQTCEMDEGHTYEDLCAQHATKNPLTGNFSCPDGYVSQLLHSGTITHVKKKQVCDKVCHRTGIFKLSRSCRCLTAWANLLSVANYNAFWCVADGSVSDLELEGVGYMFGGVYTTKNVNPITRAMKCPFHFYPLHIGEDLEVCVSTQYENAFEYSIPFGGFMSCKIGNPLASSKSNPMSKSCPKTFKRFLATVDEGCEISYCAQLQGDYETRPPKLPPFHSKPGLKKNLTQSMVIQGPYGELWIRNDQGSWIKTNRNTITGEQVLEHLSANGATAKIDSFSTDHSTEEHDHDEGLSAGASAAISSVATLFFCTLVVLAIFGVYGIWKHRKTKLIKLTRAYSSIDRGHSGPDTISIINSTENAS